MANFRTLAVFFIALALSSVVYGQNLVTGPAFLWDTTGHLSCMESGQSSRVSYEVRDSDFWGGSFIKSLLGSEVDDESASFVNPTIGSNPDIVTVFLGNKLQTEHLPKLSESMELQPLQSALKSAKSSLSVPHVSYQDGVPVMDAISNAAGSTGANLRTVGPCDQQGGILEKGNVSGAVQGLAADQAHVVVVCAHDVGGVAEEMQLLSELMGALNAMNRQHTVMYLSEPKPERPTGRLLQENAATSCDSECYAVVYAAEAAILLLIVLVAVLLGMTCHNMLDAPSKYETPKTE